ncbi:MAG: GAF domain-containing protein [Clostridia bacterium]|nr:GAF domain-containing protein [Clostridia bacterium]
MVEAAAALRLGRLNWAGFDLLRPAGDELVLGPFQGKPACVRIRVGQGVCGTALARRETLVVEDARRFPGHIACDPASRSERVVPLFTGDGEPCGVLDLDSPVAGWFDRTDAEGLEGFARLLERRVDWAAALAALRGSP